MEGINHLLNLLAIVKTEGLDGAFAEDDYGGQKSENAGFRHYPEPLRSFRQSLEDSKLCMAALSSITARLKKKIRNLQRLSAPLVLEHGIKSIPDEVLAHIFEAGHQNTKSTTFAWRVSHVSRRFRQVALRTPLLWTRLSSKSSSDQIEASILRSGQLDLEVTLYNDRKNSVGKLRSSLQLMAPHSQRWSKLVLCLNPIGVEVMTEVGLTSFPRLRCLDQRDYDLPSLVWNVPLLSRFQGSCLDFPHQIPILSQLTCIELSWNEERVTTTSLAHALYSMTSLRNLSLGFRDFSTTDGNWIQQRDTIKPHSFQIELLKITLSNYIGSGFIFSLFRMLGFLTASVVDFSLLTRQDDPHDILDENFPHGSTIRLHIARPCNIPYVLGKLLKNCTILHSVQFEASAIDYSTNFPRDWSHCPSLRHLRFQNCVTLEEKHVEVLARRLLSNAKFESLEVISCIQISEEFLEDLRDEVGERLTWSL